AWFRGKYKPRKRLYFVLIGSLLYFILPFDIISDLAPLVGITDDAVILGILIKFLADEVRRYREQFVRNDTVSTNTLTLPPGNGDPKG
ncbi:MAG: YkvA family protein, partial [candidate division WOR-3 bacterium]